MDHISSYHKLVSAVVALAVTDTTKKNDKHLDNDAKTALVFLFGDNVDPWLEMIDIDPGHFKRKLMDSMHSSGGQFSDEQKRAFRMNYQMWNQNKAQALMKYARYEGVSKCKE